MDPEEKKSFQEILKVIVDAEHQRMLQHGLELKEWAKEFCKSGKPKKFKRWVDKVKKVKDSGGSHVV